MIIATIFGYFLRDISAIFTYIQKYWSIAYPATAAIFIAGFFYKKATANGALWAMILGPIGIVVALYVVFFFNQGQTKHIF